MPSAANTTADTSGIAASSAATAAVPLAAYTIRYCAVKDTTAAAAASRPRAIIALRSHRPA